MLAGVERHRLAGRDDVLVYDHSGYIHVWSWTPDASKLRPYMELMRKAGLMKIGFKRFGAPKGLSTTIFEYRRLKDRDEALSAMLIKDETRKATKTEFDILKKKKRF